MALYGKLHLRDALKARCYCAPEHHCLEESCCICPMHSMPAATNGNALYC